ncbi:MAG: 4Fe-4S binding protein, partial [Hyphomicrobiales bacterium]
MKHGGRKVMLCSCERTMEVDGARLAKALGADGPATVHDHLCRAEVAKFAEALETCEPVLVACTQEAPLFRELAEEAGKDDLLRFTNIRERAGWTRAKGDVSPKMAALLAEAAIEIEPAGQITLKSDGVCLVYGSGQAAFDAARRLAGRLSVTLLLRDAGDLIPPNIVDMGVYGGTVTQASGRFGAFEIVVDGYAPMVPSSRDVMGFMMARDGATSQCSLIFDMSGGEPLFPSHERREGYFHVDPDRPAAVADAMFEISDLVGEFEKPLYVTYDPDICAHSRSRTTGCTRCLDVCPASAIQPNGDMVAIDPVLCGGCGSCSSVCPTGAVSYAYPGREGTIGRAQTLLLAYLGAGGMAPVLLVHDQAHGDGLIGAMARFGKGLPVNVLPFAVNEVTQTGHDFLAAALTSGARQVVLMCDPQKAHELSGLSAQAELMNTVMAGIGHTDGARVIMCAEGDPDTVEELLYGLEPLSELTPQSFSAVGDKRTIARSAFTRLNETAPEPQERIALPDGAPYGRITVDAEGCTLCLACVGACPMNAIQDSPDKPQISFVEQACVQCGLCRNTCPESVIRLEPRLDLTPAALSPVVLNEEEPFECI